MATAAAPATTAAEAQVIRTGKGARIVIYEILALFCLYYLLPLYVMVVNSLKPLDEIREGNMLNLPRVWTIPVRWCWRRSMSRARRGSALFYSRGCPQADLCFTPITTATRRGR